MILFMICCHYGVSKKLSIRGRKNVRHPPLRRLRMGFNNVISSDGNSKRCANFQFNLIAPKSLRSAYRLKNAYTDAHCDGLLCKYIIIIVAYIIILNVKSDFIILRVITNSDLLILVQEVNPIQGERI